MAETANSSSSKWATTPKALPPNVRRVINGYGEGNKAVEGTGGGFSFCELGDALLINGMLNPNATEEKIRAYVYYTETRCALPAASENEKYLLGVHETTPTTSIMKRIE